MRVKITLACTECKQLSLIHIFGSDYPFYSQDQTTEIVRDFMKHNELFTVLECSDVDALMNKNAELFCEKYKLWRMKE